MLTRHSVTGNANHVPVIPIRADIRNARGMMIKNPRSREIT